MEDFNCSYFVSGERLVHQEIYRCLTCESHSIPNACCCSGCANICHKDHEVEYLANSLAYCDCGKSDCNLIKLTYDKYGELLQEEEKFLYGGDAILSRSDKLFESHKFSGLNWENILQFVSQQCSEVVSHSKETFWVGCDWNYISSSSSTSLPSSSQECRCQLEELALFIFNYHINILSSRSPTKFSYNKKLSGAEWWIQIKDLNDEEKTAIDLHYDKDEDIAEKFDVGIFPSLSTVTYLTSQGSNLLNESNNNENKFLNPQPTVIFSTTCNDPIGTDIRDCYLSYPVFGKHVSFDGKLLHGAPSNSSLRNWRGEIPFTQTSYVSNKRVTFLVNIWLNHHPANVHPLPLNIIEKITPSIDPHYSSISSLLHLVQNIQDIYYIPVTEEFDDDNNNDNNCEGNEQEKNMKLEKILLPFVPKDQQNNNYNNNEGEEEKEVNKDEDENSSELLVLMNLPSIVNHSEESELNDLKLGKFSKNFYNSFHIQYLSQNSAARIISNNEDTDDEYEDCDDSEDEEEELDEI